MDRFYQQQCDCSGQLFNFEVRHTCVRCSRWPAVRVSSLPEKTKSTALNNCGVGRRVWQTESSVRSRELLANFSHSMLGRKIWLIALQNVAYWHPVIVGGLAFRVVAVPASKFQISGEEVLD